MSHSTLTRRPFRNSVALALGFVVSAGLSACSGDEAMGDGDDDLGSGGAGAAPGSAGGLGNLGAGGDQLGASGGSQSGGGDNFGSGGGNLDGGGGGDFGSGSGGANEGSGGANTVDCGDGPKSGFYVEDGKLYDINCNEFIARGVNDPYVWYKTANNNNPPSPEQRFADIAAVGSNAVRVVLSAGKHGEGWPLVTGSEITNIINWCKQNKLVAILEVHDSTGYPEKIGAQNPQIAVDYWKSADIKNAIVGQEAFVIINIANESFGNGDSEQTDSTSWENFYTGAVPELRSAGIKHTLLVDAPNWGQDHRFIMRDGAGATNIFNADPDKNTTFAVHMYDVYGQPSTVTSYFDNFLSKGLVLFVGEFAADHGPGKDVDEATIMAQAEKHGVGYLGWSWDGNSTDLSSLDIVNNWSPTSLSSWGAALVNDTNGIKNTAVTCSCFD